MPLVRISHRAGVTDAHRQSLSDGVQEAMESTVVENELADWSFGNGEAQHVR